MPLSLISLSLSLLPSFFALASCVSYALMLTWPVFSPVLCLFVDNLTNAIVSTWRAENLKCYLKKKFMSFRSVCPEYLVNIYGRVNESCTKWGGGTRADWM